jgi:hypothetical protein
MCLIFLEVRKALDKPSDDSKRFGKTIGPVGLDVDKTLRA